ncbi:hypothetical protein BZA05DRAFT_446805 [Tricharina praecox]|uniref:uncharacterized protein n=1 Tax=Tricharina praecox TaxID=43433 RepID=UPI00221E4D05|nr:uncharacterized protein BZA05DRAFT_446805 [Tricharina praecox]KAI5848091.1 hypothetical protein BZA05DRAFT_446805 [Tricharina praecox]
MSPHKHNYNLRKRAERAAAATPPRRKACKTSKTAASRSSISKTARAAPKTIYYALKFSAMARLTEMEITKDTTLVEGERFHRLSCGGKRAPRGVVALKISIPAGVEGGEWPDEMELEAISGEEEEEVGQEEVQEQELEQQLEQQLQKEQHQEEEEQEQQLEQQLQKEQLQEQQEENAEEEAEQEEAEQAANNSGLSCIDTNQRYIQESFNNAKRIMEKKKKGAMEIPEMSPHKHNYNLCKRVPKPARSGSGSGGISKTARAAPKPIYIYYALKPSILALRKA